jgi:hypothetical protein
MISLTVLTEYAEINQKLLVISRRGVGCGLCEIAKKFIQFDKFLVAEIKIIGKVSRFRRPFPMGWV